MENSVNSISAKGYDPPLKQCIDLVSVLAEKGCKFAISVRIEDSFVFQLESEGAPAAPKERRKRGPSYRRRQERRRILRKNADPLRNEPASEGEKHSDVVPPPPQPPHPLPLPRSPPPLHHQSDV